MKFLAFLDSLAAWQCMPSGIISLWYLCAEVGAMDPSDYRIRYVQVDFLDATGALSNHATQRCLLQKCS